MDVSNKTIAELMQMRYDLQTQFNSDMAPIAEAIAEHEEAALNQLKKGVKVKGFKLKKGRKSRSVVDPDKLVQKLLLAGATKSDIYDVTVKGVPALDKLIKANFSKEEGAQVYSRHIDEKEGAPSVEYTGV